MKSKRPGSPASRWHSSSHPRRGAQKTLSPAPCKVGSLSPSLSRRSFIAPCQFPLYRSVKILIIFSPSCPSLRQWLVPGWAVLQGERSSEGDTLGSLPDSAPYDGRGGCVSILCPPNLGAGRNITVLDASSLTPLFPLLGGHPSCMAPGIRGSRWPAHKGTWF